MNRMLTLIISRAAVSAAGAATAQTGGIEDDYVGCLTDRYFDDHDIAVLSRDWGRRDALMATVCYDLEGIEYSVVKKSFMSIRIQVTIDGETLRLTTSREAIK